MPTYVNREETREEGGCHRHNYYQGVDKLANEHADGYGTLLHQGITQKFALFVPVLKLHLV